MLSHFPSTRFARPARRRGRRSERHSYRRAMLLAALLAAVATAVVVPIVSASASAGAGAESAPRSFADGLGIKPGKIKHVWLIILENKSYDEPPSRASTTTVTCGRPARNRARC